MIFLIIQHINVYKLLNHPHFVQQEEEQGFFIMLIKYDVLKDMSEVQLCFLYEEVMFFLSRRLLGNRGTHI